MDKSQLISDNINLVYYVLNKYYPYSLKDEDLIQAGMLGLCESADRFDPALGKFSVYAVNGIRNRMSMELKNRKKFAKQISLNTEIQQDDNDVLTLEDMLPGDDDVDFLDIDSLLATLTETERQVYELQKLGHTYKDIGIELGVSDQTVCTICRKIKSKWRKII